MNQGKTELKTNRIHSILSTFFGNINSLVIILLLFHSKSTVIHIITCNTHNVMIENTINKMGLDSTHVVNICKNKHVPKPKSFVVFLKIY